MTAQSPYRLASDALDHEAYQSYEATVLQTCRKLCCVSFDCSETHPTWKARSEIDPGERAGDTLKGPGLINYDLLKVTDWWWKCAIQGALPSFRPLVSPQTSH